MESSSKKVVILGAAGRDFHNFNVFFRGNPTYKVVAFTSTQIPGIENRVYPPELAGPLYPQGIPIYSESRLEEILDAYGVDIVVFSYSDVSHEHVMHLASIAHKHGADFWLLGPKSTMLKSSKPVIAVTAVRTGSGKSQTSRKIASILKEFGFKVGVIRHPMPYGNLASEAVQRFSTFEDLDKWKVTIEEREEYEPHLARGHVVYAGVDYGKILSLAEKENDIILWDGGNNDFPFIRPDLWITVADPFRAGHELSYHPGETCFRSADVIIINKVDTASFDQIEMVRENARKLNPKAIVIEAASPIFVEGYEMIRGKRVLIIEDGPTLTHGGMEFGAGYVAARKYGAAEIVDPRPYAVGSIKRTYEIYPHLKGILPAMGYGETQIKELEETVNGSDADLVIVATPVNLGRILKINKPYVRVTYELQEIGRPTLRDVLEGFVSKIKR
ncbi:MAG: cyclic 2,3-diphosphoglycerate synthase [Desulfurococcales archaeon]|uniref:GTPase n=1 Tax=Fervidicoccus fontis TaxID=683846 RepID=A0A7J3SJR4_9CREN